MAHSKNDEHLPRMIPKYVGAARTAMFNASKWAYEQKTIIKSHDCSYPFVFHKLSRLTFNLREVI